VARPAEPARLEGHVRDPIASPTPARSGVRRAAAVLLSGRGDRNRDLAGGGRATSVAHRASSGATSRRERSRHVPRHSRGIGWVPPTVRLDPGTGRISFPSEGRLRQWDGRAKTHSGRGPNTMRTRSRSVRRSPGVRSGIDRPAATALASPLVATEKGPGWRIRNDEG
jgi:hypothetical protein